MDTGHWLINEGVYIHENMFGFIYEITNNVNGKKYIGKKQCVRRVKRKPLKGKTRNRIDQKESDWKTYTSSSKELNEDITKYGKERFDFKILKICGSKWELGYEEIKEQISRDVLRRDDYYNGVLNIRVGRPPNNLIR
jgi:hypothetical protein